MFDGLRFTLMSGPSVLCPIDFSDPSRGALVYAAAIADHFATRLTVLAVNDPLLAEAAASAGFVPSLAEETEHELQRVCRAVLGQPVPGPKQLELRVRTGKPALEILRDARETATDLIVMSSRGQTGVRKMFFGSTTERVLRETFVPVLVTPPDRPAGHSLSDFARQVSHVLAPVDLTPASLWQVSLAGTVAQALSVPLLIAHVLEPIAIPVRIRLAMGRADASRRARAEELMNEIVASVVAHVNTETLVVGGDPADEIVKLSEARHANLIVMGLHSSELLGPRMGSVTYRVLALSRTFVLAVPPNTDNPVHRGGASTV
jgi:nucleotide-binding universal stress UspA family protein